MSGTRPRSIAQRSRSHLEVKGKNVVFTLCLSHNTHFCVPYHIVGASESYGHNSSFFVLFCLFFFSEKNKAKFYVNQKK